jgi:hypothetical protein
MAKKNRLERERTVMTTDLPFGVVATASPRLGVVALGVPDKDAVLVEVLMMDLPKAKALHRELGAAIEQLSKAAH